MPTLEPNASHQAIIAQINLGGTDGAAALAAHEADSTSVHGVANMAALATSAALAAHEADTTAIHGITDTAALATTAALAAHEADSTAVHGIADTAVLATATTVATAKAQALAPWRTLACMRGGAIAASVTGADDYTPTAGSDTTLRTATGVAGAASSTHHGLYFDPADYAVTGLTLQARLRITVAQNDTAPGVNFTGVLRQATATTGNPGQGFSTLAAAILSTAAVTAPAANSISTATGTDTDASDWPAGLYIPAVTISGAMTALSAVNATVELQIRNA